jgi:putative Ca2+/H+ antiporter (TMEM165/GDT1 family)
MQIPFKNKKDVYSGLAMVLLGSFAASIGKTYKLGTVSQMGPGFMPTWLGIILAAVGFLIMFLAFRSHAEPVEAEWRLPDTRGSVCIIGGLLAFVVCAKYIGFVPASLSLLFISAMGDREQTWKSAALLAVIVTTFGVIVFYYALSQPFPLFRRGF